MSNFLHCKDCGVSQSDGWSEPEAMRDIWANRFVLRHVENILWDFRSNIHGESVTINFAIEHRDHNVILQNEHGDEI